MKKIVLMLFAAACACTAAFAQDAPAFPGAEGHGRYVTGGRGGEVRHVTTLVDDGKTTTKGTLRWAVNGSTKKTVVFDVGGVIALKKNLNIGSNTTILGQTAPAPGITLRYYTLSTENSNNIIVRFMRFRRGQEKDVNDGADAATGRHSTGIIFDHCSFSWSIDEVASFYDNNNFTMQWCTIGESLNNAGHGKGAHGYGGIWGGKLASLHHNLICHVNNRSPRFNGARYNWTGYTGNKYYSEYKWENAVQAENVDYRNCVVYNADGCYGGPGGGKINMVGNYLKSGPAATITKLTQVTVGASGNAEGYPIYWDMTSRYYVEGNIIDGQEAGWNKFKYDNGTIERDGKRYSLDPNHYNGSSENYLTVNGKDYVCMQLDQPAPTGEVTTHSAAKAYAKVLQYSGASLYPDDVDLRYFEEALNGTATYSGSVTGKKGRIDLVSDVNGYTEANFGTGSRSEGFDNDNDGMPDVWETANGLNPNNASDALTYTLDSKGWYTNLEVYANSLVEDIMKAENADAKESVDEYYPACTKVEIPSEGGQTNPTIDGKDATVTWVFDNGQDGQTAQYSAGVVESLESNNVVLGKNLSYNGIQTIGSLKETKIRALVPNEESANDDNAVTFTFATKSGYTFQATDISFYATRLGTDGGKLDASWKDAGGTTVLTTGQTPNRNNGDPAFTEYSFTNVNGTPTEGECSLIINIYALGQVKDDGTNNLKDYGLCNIKVSGKLTDSALGINQSYSETEVSRTLYNLKGQKIAAPVKGVNIVLKRMSNGTTQSRKVILK